MTKFTPGKWEINVDKEETQADARLIAAAPEMYKLLCGVIAGKHSRALIVSAKVLLNQIDGIEEDVELPKGALLWFEPFPYEFCERCYGVHTDPLDGFCFCSVCQFNIDDPKCYRHEENAELVERLRRDDRILSMRTGFRTHVF